VHQVTNNAKITTVAEGNGAIAGVLDCNTYCNYVYETPQHKSIPQAG